MFAQLLVGGLTLGCVYALAGLGFVLVFRTLGAVNFAQGDLLTVGSYVAASIGASLHVGGFVQLILLVPAMALCGVLLYVLLFRWLVGRSFLNSVILTAVVGMAAQAAIRAVYGPVPRSVPPLLGPTRHEWGPITVTNQELLVAGVTASCVVLMYLLLQRTMLGRTMRALASDFEMARVLGVRVHTIGAAVLAVGTVLAGLAGFLIAPTLVVSPQLGSPLLLGVFTAIVVGGFGSIPGSIVGGVVVGMVETLAAGYLSSAYQSVFLFLILTMVLLIRPRGIFGEHLAARF